LISIVRVTLKIESGFEKRDVTVEGEVSVGRTDAADIALGDAGLSRRNTTFFIDDGELYVADENSTNGTFVNGVKVEGRPRVLRDGDLIKIGSETAIQVQIGAGNSSYSAPVAVVPAQQDTRSSSPAPAPAPPQGTKKGGPPIILIAAGVMTVFILLLGAVALIAVSYAGSSGSGNVATSNPPPIQTGALIPVRVIDPLGGEDEDDLDDLIASWEVAEDELKADTVADITGGTGDEEKELNVTAAFLADRKAKAFEARPGETGIRPAGLDVPKELFGDGVIKQKAKLASMIVGSKPYRQPMDFAELAEKRLSGELIEMPMATNSFFLSVGGSAQDKPFSSFSFKDGVSEIPVGSPKYGVLSKLASNFAGQKYDLNNPSDRRQMRMRLLRMFQRPAKPILKELADAYFTKYNRPLVVTSLTRSMDYQILLNATNANSFKVRGEGSLPPHTSGCAFDLSRKQMPAEEQNFVMHKLAEMERAGKLDALIEYGTNACFHVFIYWDGVAPKM
jgi:pSer/pThr/pTyr-binding forkhead associated (FHA) protein